MATSKPTEGQKYLAEIEEMEAARNLPKLNPTNVATLIAARGGDPTDPETVEKMRRELNDVALGVQHHGMLSNLKESLKKK